jgi:hypothetical protein
LHLAGIGIGALQDRPHGGIATRGVGVAIAAMGAWFFCKVVGT